MEPKKTYTPRARRNRKTSPTVWLGDIFSRYLITAGGIGTIVAVIGVFAFLALVAIPLFLPAKVGEKNHQDIKWAKHLVQMGMDEDQSLCWALFGDGTL